MTKNVRRRRVGSGATLGFEEALWQAADKMRVIADRSSRSVEVRRPEDEIRENLKGVGFDV